MLDPQTRRALGARASANGPVGSEFDIGLTHVWVYDFTYIIAYMNMNMNEEKRE